MGTITEKMSYLKETKQAIRTAIEEKGVSVADTDTFRSYASKIGTISGGGGGTKWYVGDFYSGQMYEGNNGDLFLNTGQTDRGVVLQFQDGTWNPVGSILGPQGENGVDGTDGSIAPVGSIVIWGSEDIPENYLKCEGQILSREEYASLFNIIGTTFGDGDGTTTFALPDMRNYVVVGMSDDPDINAIGKKYGEKEHTLTVDEMPSHDHVIHANIPNAGGNDTLILKNAAYWSSGVDMHTYATGGGQPHNNMQPSMAMVFIIKAYEITPADVNVVDSLDGNSTTDAPSVHAVNTKINSLVEDNTVYINTLETTMESFSVDGLDIVGDGEHYEVTLEALADEETEVYIRFNNYTGTDYYWGYMYMEETTGGTGFSAIAATSNAATYIGDRLKMDTGSIPSIMKMDIYYTPNKSGSGGHVSYIMNYVSSSRRMVYLGGNLLEGVDNINSIQFFTPHGNFVPKTRVTVRKVR